MQIPEASKLPIRAEHPGGFSNTNIYSLPGQPGLYRRVPREGRAGLTPGDGNALAIVPTGTREGEPVSSLCELQRWTRGERLLRELLSEVASPDPDQEG